MCNHESAKAIPASGFAKILREPVRSFAPTSADLTAPRSWSISNRDIIKLFSGLRVSDSFLLQNNLREILFRKPV